jgi:hypothetical protein
LRATLARSSSNNEVTSIIEARDVVFARFHDMFLSNNILHMSEQEFREFLLLENNRHWSGLHRHAPKMCSDMPLLRKALTILLDESLPIDNRLDQVIEMVPGMGKAVITAILLIAYPKNYGVWNNTSEGGLKTLGIWPSFERGESFGNRYLKINQILKALASDLKIDLWTLDSLFWPISKTESIQGPSLDGENNWDSSNLKVQRFVLESHLHEFLVDNWDALPLGKDWAIYAEDGDDFAGDEYPCGDIGYIDILGRHRKERRWLVIELKRNQSSDATIGQILRYIGWVKIHLAKPGEDVEGLVISHSADDKIRYALSVLSNIGLQLYEVEFKLNPSPQLDVIQNQSNNKSLER